MKRHRHGELSKKPKKELIALVKDLENELNDKNNLVDKVNKIASNGLGNAGLLSEEEALKRVISILDEAVAESGQRQWA